jgi:hypothetical protein
MARCERVVTHRQMYVIFLTVVSVLLQSRRITLEHRPTTLLAASPFSDEPRLHDHDRDRPKGVSDPTLPGLMI